MPEPVITSAGAVVVCSVDTQEVDPILPIMVRAVYECSNLVLYPCKCLVIRMHESHGHSMHLHLSDESLVTYSSFDSPRTKHRKNQERCAEVLITEHLKKYIDKYNNFIIPLDEQIELYACHLHLDFQILKNGEIKVELQVQALKQVQLWKIQLNIIGWIICLS